MTQVARLSAPALLTALPVATLALSGCRSAGAPEPGPELYLQESAAAPEPALTTEGPTPVPEPIAIDPEVDAFLAATARDLRIRAEKRRALADHYVAQGKRHLERQEYREAINNYDEARQLDPDSADALEGLRLARTLAKENGSPR